jgi:hypothetical protein
MGIVSLAFRMHVATSPRNGLNNEEVLLSDMTRN